MSHFTTLVVLPEIEGGTGDERHEALERALQPFHEYECTGVEDEYVVFVDYTEEVTKEYENSGEKKVRLGASHPDPGTLVDTYDDMFWRTAAEAEVKKIEARDTRDMRYRTSGFGAKFGYKVYELLPDCEVVKVPFREMYDSVEAFAIDWHGYIVEDGKIGNYTNPNSKWDWWVVGGRWSGLLAHKPGAFAAKGETGAFGKDHIFSDATNACDIIQYKDLDLDAMTSNHIQTMKQSYVSIMQRMQKFDSKDEKAKQSYLSLYDMTPEMTEEEYVKVRAFKGLGGLTFAILKDGKWYERGDMGWWGCVSNEKDADDWKGEASELLADLKPTDWLIMVDCHI